LALPPPVRSDIRRLPAFAGLARGAGPAGAYNAASAPVAPVPMSAMPTGHADPALDALLLPFAQGALSWPETDPDSVASGAAPQTLFLRARAGEALRPHAGAGLLAVQSFRPEADALRRMGATVAGVEARAGTDATAPTDPHAVATAHDTPRAGGWPCVLVLPPRQREEARALLAYAVRACAPGGVVVAAQANDAGAKSGQADLAALAGLDGQLSKYHCRVFWTRKAPARVDAGLLQAWAALDAPRRIADARFPGGGFLSRPGVFAWDRVDAASALLAAHLPDTLSGRVADLGAGVGFLSALLMQRCAGLQALDLYEAEARALSLAQANLAALASQAASAAPPALGFHWHDVAAGLPRPDYDAVVMNPPFHALGRDDRPDLGRAFIAAAADALRRGGQLWLVANRHLPYEDLLRTRFADVRTVAQADGFKVIAAVAA